MEAACLQVVILMVCMASICLPVAMFIIHMELICLPVAMSICTFVLPVGCNIKLLDGLKDTKSFTKIFRTRVHKYMKVSMYN